jgi:hypothetical protein
MAVDGGRGSGSYTSIKKHTERHRRLAHTASVALEREVTFQTLRRVEPRLKYLTDGHRHVAFETQEESE